MPKKMSWVRTKSCQLTKGIGRGHSQRPLRQKRKKHLNSMEDIKCSDIFNIFLVLSFMPINVKICQCCVRKNRGTLVAHTSTLHSTWGIMPYLLFFIWTRRNMTFGHLPTHVPFAMPNNFNGGKEEMSTM